MYKRQEIGRDPEKIACVEPPFPRLTYTEAVNLLTRKGMDISWGDDFGAADETTIANESVSYTHLDVYKRQVKYKR